MKKFQVETWFRIVDEVDSYEEAQRIAKARKDHKSYKDTVIKTLKITEDKVEKI